MTLKASRNDATRFRFEVWSVSKHATAARGDSYLRTRTDTDWHTGCAAEVMINGDVCVTRFFPMLYALNPKQQPGFKNESDNRKSLETDLMFNWSFEWLYIVFENPSFPWNCHSHTAWAPWYVLTASLSEQQIINSSALLCRQQVTGKSLMNVICTVHAKETFAFLTIFPSLRLFRGLSTPHSRAPSHDNSSPQGSAVWRVSWETLAPWNPFQRGYALTSNLPWALTFSSEKPAITRL